MTSSSNSFRKTAAHSIAVLVLSCTSFAYADGKDDVVAAAAKSFSAKTYSWVGKLADDPEVDAKTEANGLTSVVVTIDDKPQTAVLKDNVYSAALTEAGWKNLDGVVHDPKLLDLAVWMGNWFKRQPAHNVNQWIAHVQGFTADGAGQYTGNYQPDEAIRALGGRHKGTTVTDAQGTVRITIKDGYMTLAESHLTGTVANSDGTKKVDRQESFFLSDFDTAKPDVPSEAKQLLTK